MTTPQIIAIIYLSLLFLVSQVGWLKDEDSGWRTLAIVSRDVLIILSIIVAIAVLVTLI